MNIALLSVTSGYHQLAKVLSKDSNVFHYGAHKSLLETSSYHPIPIDIPISPNIENEVNQILKQVKKQKIDFIMASGLSVPANNTIHLKLSKLKIPYFFVNREVAAIEYNKFFCKKILNELGIPTGVSIGNKQLDGKYLFDNFYNIPRPFVVKSYPYQYGRQTTVVDNTNYEEVYLDLFSNKLGKGYRLTNINDDFGLVLEEVVDIKKEISCHFLLNKTGWTYFGSARDYKKSYDNDTGFNCTSSGAYNIHEIDNRIFEYVDKIYNHLKAQGISYRGFLFLGIAIDSNDIPVVLEINTRSGDPELETIIGSVKNNLSNLFLLASSDAQLPDVKHDVNKKTVTINLLNKTYDWTTEATDLPHLTNIPKNISFGIEGGSKVYLKHSGFTATAKTYEEASNRIYKYLETQNLGQFRYRSDIGILK